MPRKPETETRTASAGPAVAAPPPPPPATAWPSLSAKKRQQLLDAVNADGTAKVARWIGCNSETLARVIAGLRVHRATILLINRATFEREPPAVVQDAARVSQ